MYVTLYRQLGYQKRTRLGARGQAWKEWTFDKGTGLPRVLQDSALPPRTQADEALWQQSPAAPHGASERVECAWFIPE